MEVEWRGIVVVCGAARWQICWYRCLIKNLYQELRMSRKEFLVYIGNYKNDLSIGHRLLPEQIVWRQVEYDRQ